MERIYKLGRVNFKSDFLSHVPSSLATVNDTNGIIKLKSHMLVVINYFRVVSLLLLSEGFAEL